MKHTLKLALSLAFAGGLAGQAHAEFDNLSYSSGQAMMQQNNILLRNGDDVWQRIREGFQMDEVNADLVRRFERQYAANPAGIERTLGRSHKYLFHIINEVEKRGMPTELALLPVVESAFVPQAESPVGAAGLWQFMPATGRHYGLEQTWWYDGRRDVVGATQAALNYLEYLHGLFGDWSLALAAYNWGEGNVSRAQERNRAQGLPDDFEHIRMPAETRNYVPKLIAVRNVLSDPKRYNVALNKFPNRPYFVAVSTGKHIDIDVAAKLANVPEAELKTLNPGYKRPLLAYKNGRQLLIPVDHFDRFEKNLASWDKPLSQWQAVVAQDGDTPDVVAERYNMTVAELRSVNGALGGRLQASQPLLVAQRGSSAAPALIAAADRDDQAEAPRTVAARPVSDSPARPVVTVARAPVVADKAPVVAAAPVARPAVMVASADTRPAASSRSSSAVTTDLPPAVDTVASPRPFADIEVVPSPVVATAASAEDAISEIASISPAVDTVARTEPARPQQTVAVATSSRHTVSSGDTLYSLAKRYNMSVAQLRDLNQLNGNALQLGQTLQVAAGSSSDLITVAASSAAAPRTQQYQYVVQRGDTLYSIARKFGLDHQDLRRWNDERKLARLQPGNRVTLVVGI
ncbi:lytic transglycosylase [Microvirgula aerodenitrificans]|uniref:lytic transglycosylase n=1 Tax=Microvirgula aerodenitrificans TaxID=57480 RepID=UPI00048B8109|nr:LysM peptidoglycan-binding domain-containing protein [Microvirgula aerodenitrificans]